LKISETAEELEAEREMPTAKIIRVIRVIRG
jgi:hypothetical protein